MTTKIESLIRTKANRVQKMKWTATFIEIHKKIFIVQNIKEDFRDTGIHSFLSSKVLNRVSRLKTSKSKTSSSAFRITMPFIEIVLTNFSLDINAVRVTNTVLNQLIQFEESLSTSRKEICQLCHSIFRTTLCRQNYIRERKRGIAGDDYSKKTTSKWKKKGCWRCISYYNGENIKWCQRSGGEDSRKRC